MYRKKIFLFGFISLFFSTLGWAKLDFEDHAFPEYVTSARALAMGNAYISKVDDAWAAFYNPAGLGTVREPSFHLGNIHLESSQPLLNYITGSSAMEIPGRFFDSLKADKLRDELADKPGTLYQSRFNLFPNFTARGVTLGYMISQRNRAVVNDDEDGDFEVNERRDHGPVFALNGSFFGGIFKVGISAVYLFRRELHKTIAENEPELKIEDSDYKVGRSLQLTTGTRLTLPFTYLPTFSAVLRNSTQNDFEEIEKGGSPQEIKQTIDLGFSITPQIADATRLHLEVNLRDAHNQYETNVRRRLGMGAELDFNRRIFIRSGFGDGWGSLGLGVRSRLFIFDLTTYAVDRSTDGYRKVEDRRWALNLSSGI